MSVGPDWSIGFIFYKRGLVVAWPEPPKVCTQPWPGSVLELDSRVCIYFEYQVKINAHFPCVNVLPSSFLPIMPHALFNVAGAKWNNSRLWIQLLDHLNWIWFKWLIGKVRPGQVSNQLHLHNFRRNCFIKDGTGPVLTTMINVTPFGKFSFHLPSSTGRSESRNNQNSLPEGHFSCFTYRYLLCWQRGLK